MSQIIFNGKESYKKIDEIFAKLSPKKIFLVGNGAERFKPIKNILDSSGVPYVGFNDFTPNPQYEDVQKGITAFLGSGCDTIIAFGGGTTIDVAKCIKLFSGLDHGRNYLEQKYSDTKIPLIAIPGTAGTGSESTSFAVLYYNGDKYSVAHQSLLPDYAILVHETLKTLPLYQKKCTMMDALCQAIESWWSVNSTEESRSYSKKSVEMIVQNMSAYINDNSESAAETIMLASNYAGRAINIAKTTAAHAMSYKITSMYGLPHGHAVAVCLPKIWAYMISNMNKCSDKRGIEYLNGIFNDIAVTLGHSSPEKAVSEFEDLLDRLDLSSPKLKSEDDLNILCSSVNVERLSNNPVSMTEDVLLETYKAILGN
ncbi:iron-containing alcohol dehydrogenase family protein [Candidatus Nomurabacteria bacterium]|nr:iron-containing alcohol dehydrogenase family protein [Candidatus Nomurabacteria bacterium]